MTRKTLTAGVAAPVFLLLPAQAPATFHLMRRLGLLLVPLAFVALTAIRGAAQTTFTVTGVCCVSYDIDGQPDPTLTVVRGQTYNFNLVACDFHPFRIQSTQGFRKTLYSNVTNNVGTGGTVTLTVPVDEPASTLYYQCDNHLQMNGVINVVDQPALTPTPSPTPTPTSTPTPCVGDCNDDGSITVDEILTMVNIALGNADISECEPGDADHNGQITVDEILAAVDEALNGCGS
jgi:hypothetical protein